MVERGETKATYIPLDNYEANDYEPFGQRVGHFCDGCKHYYRRLHDVGITKEPFMPRCYGDVRRAMPTMEELGIDDEDLYNEMSVVNDPLKWAEVFFGWKPRWYQEEMIACSANWKVVRAGRRLGKTAAISVIALHHAFTNDHHTVLVVAPYQSQVAKIFQEMQKHIDTSEILQDSIERQRNSPPVQIVFKNGSVLIGFASGKGQSQHSDQIRGQDADLIVLDEVDMMNDYDLETIMAILASHAHCKIWASSTPRGWRKKFWEWCTKKNLRFREFHYISSESPEWTQDTEDYFRETTSQMGYLHEFLAEFGEEAFGVFKTVDIDSCLFDYSLKDCLPQMVRGPLIMGVDWNLNAGTHIVIVEWTGEIYKVVHKTVVPKSEFTQMGGVAKIKELNQLWNPRFIYVDEGYGSAQIEMLKHTGLEDRSSGLYEKIKPIMMGRSVEIQDPKTGEKIQRQAKQFMVELTANRVEQRQMMIPREEDTHIIIEPDDPDNSAVGIVQQMRDFRVVRESPTGQPIYSQDYEHTLTAMMLTILGFQMEFGGLQRTHHATKVTEGPRIGENHEEHTSRSGSEESVAKRPALPRAEKFSFKKEIPVIDPNSGVGPCIRVDPGSSGRIAGDAATRRLRRGSGFSPRRGRRKAW